MSKFIIFCADGTWNGPDQDENDDHLPDPTNVYKLFAGLAGAVNADAKRLNDEQEKELVDGGNTFQVAKYIHGVGDSENPIRRILGGVFGAGVISRIVRGYTFISRHYQDGDRIVIAGFSRGAYTARALAGLIASQGLLARRLTADKSEAYHWGARAWYRYRKQVHPGNGDWLKRFAEALTGLPDFLLKGELSSRDLVPVSKIEAVAVWDTVGAMGVPRYHNGGRADAFAFTNTSLSPKVGKGFHAVALDEQRIDFTPTLWDPAGNVVQMAFPGAHADVGGGYTTQEGESGLSDIALEWMVENLKSLGVRFTQPVYEPFKPDPKGTAHKPWEHAPFEKFGKLPRVLPGIPGHPSIRARMKAQAVIHEPGETPAPYKPTNWP